MEEATGGQGSELSMVYWSMHAGQIVKQAVYALSVLFGKQSKRIHQFDFRCGGHEDHRLSEGIDWMSPNCRFHVMLTQQYCIHIQYIL